MGERVRVGFIGCGSIARQMQMRWYAALPERVEIVALADPDPAALRAAAQQTGVHATACHQDYDDLLARGDLDAVEVCTPNHLHAGPTIAALQARSPWDGSRGCSTATLPKSSASGSTPAV